MAAAIRLSDFSATPLYNIKAVVQATDISPSTLRAWERRYHMCQPQRSESGYRLYSDRDIAVIRWLKSKLDAGMSISHAVAWLQSITADDLEGAGATLPDPTGRAADTGFSANTAEFDVHDYGAMQQQVLGALLDYDEDRADQILATAFALYPLEDVGEQIITPTLIEIGNLWQRGALGIAREHYATNYLVQRLGALLRSTPNGRNESAIWVTCAPGERHEIGLLLLAIYLRRRGYQVCYLGQDIPEADLIQEVVTLQPALVLFSAGSRETAAALGRLCSRLVELGTPRPMIGYGGRTFNLHPDLRSTIAGVFLGANAKEAVQGINELFTARMRPNKRTELLQK